VKEETGVTIGAVTYHSSQPWPFPTQLMIGMLAHATSTQISIDTSELMDAQWFTRADVLKMMMKSHPDGIAVPPNQAIAHHLIKAFLYTTAKL